MNNRLLGYFEKELEGIKKEAVEFSRANPKLARNLGINEKGIDDPNISRLIESIAFLNAKVNKKLDDGVEELSESMMGTLYPDCEAPFPALGAVQFSIDGSLATSSTIKKGELITISNEKKQEWTFAVAADTDINPIHITDCTYRGLPFEKPEIENQQAIKSKLSLTFRPNKEVAKDDEIAIESIRLKLDDDQRINIELYEAIAKEFVYAEIELGEEKGHLKPHQINKLGFDKALTILPESYQQLGSMQLAREALNSIESFLYVEVDQLQAKLNGTDEIHIHLYFNNHSNELDKNINKNSLQYGCVPIVNLYAQTAEPYLLKGNETRDIEIRGPKGSALEVYKIRKVECLLGKSERHQILAAYEPRLGQETTLRWTAKRANRQLEKGTIGKIELKILQDSDFNNDDIIISPKVWATNRQGLSQDINRSEKLNIEFVNARSEFASINLVETIKEGKRVELNGEARWSILKRLNIGYISEQGVEAVKELLNQVNIYQDEQINLMIEAITSCTTKQVVKRAFDKEHSGFISGQEVTLQISRTPFANSSLYLFGLVISNLLTELTGLNSFTQLVIETTGQARERIEYPAQTGEVRLI